MPWGPTDKRSKYLRDTGRSMWLNPQEYERALKRLRWLVEDRGMSHRAVGEIVGGHQTGVSGHLSGRHTTMKRDLGNAIMSVAPPSPPGKSDDATGFPLGSRRCDPTGSVRRMQALCARGWTGAWLNDYVGNWSPGQANRLIANEPPGAKRPFRFVSGYRRDQIVALYDKLETVDPADMGLPQESIRRALAVARKRKLAPPHCWDSDTIDDPAAWPEWTGLCNTNAGYSYHRANDIPMCAACLKAHSTYTGQHGQHSQLDIVTIGELTAAGYSAKEIAERLHISDRSVTRARGRINNGELQRIADAAQDHGS